jgi:hypothetical protein
MKRTATLIVSACICLAAVRAASAQLDLPDFQSEVAPLLKNHCVKCHGPSVTKAGLNLAVPAGIARGGESGRAVVSGKPEESLLWTRVAVDEMPEDEPLPAVERIF